MAEIPPYSYDVFWSKEDDEYVATCAEVPGLSGLGPSRAEAIGELEVALSAWLDYLTEQGLTAPVPLSGLVVVVSPGDVKLTGVTVPGSGTTWSADVRQAKLPEAHGFGLVVRPHAA